MTPLGKRFAAMVLALCLALGLAELALRALAAPATPRATGIAGGDGRLRPFTQPQPADTVRVLALGDSFTYGVGVHEDDAWPARLERRFAASRGDVRVEVRNAGVSGLNTEEELEWLHELLGGSHGADLVILGFCLNDAEPSDRGLRSRLTGALTRRTPVGEAELALYRRSALFLGVYERLETLRQRRAFAAYYRGLYADGRDTWLACRAALEGMRDSLEARSVPLLVVVFPVFDSQLDERYPYRDIHDKLDRTLAALDIPGLDLLADYRGIDAGRLAVVPFTDPHPDELAYRLAVDRIHVYLRDCLTLRPGSAGPRAELHCSARSSAGLASNAAVDGAAR